MPEKAAQPRRAVCEAAGCLLLADPVARQHPRVLAHARILDARHGIHHAGVATGVINVCFIQWCGVKGAGVDSHPSPAVRQPLAVAPRSATRRRLAAAGT